MAEAWPVTVHPARFRADETRMQVLARTAGMLGDLEAAIRRELGADQIPPKTRPPGDGTGCTGCIATVWTGCGPGSKSWT
jgi:hypothetical protein